MLLKRLWRTSPDDLAFGIGRKLRGGASFDYTLPAVLRSAKHMRPVGLIDRWERYWRVISVSGAGAQKSNFDFADKTVFELGCGPILGWGPMALFLGARQYYYDEPAALPEIIGLPVLRDRYFKVFHRELVANYGDRMTFDQFYEKCLNHCHPLSLAGADEPHNGIDLFLSNSVLEHIPEAAMAGALARLVSMANPGAHYFHAVDFGQHGLLPSFDDMYRRPRNQGLGKGFINLLKPSEMSAALAGAGCRGDVVDYKVLAVDEAKLDAFWRPFALADLTTGVAFYVGSIGGEEG